MNRATRFEALSPADLLQMVAAISGIEGLTLSGGDPFDQNKHLLLEFLSLVRQCTPLTVMCYTGRTLQQLREADDAAVNEQILACIDILVDGPYRESQNAGQKWRGSANQTIHFLTARYAHLKERLLVATDRSVEVDLSIDNVLTIAGIPQPGFVQQLAGQLAARGVSFSMPSE